MVKKVSKKLVTQSLGSNIVKIDEGKIHRVMWIRWFRILTFPR